MTEKNRPWTTDLDWILNPTTQLLQVDRSCKRKYKELEKKAPAAGQKSTAKMHTFHSHLGLAALVQLYVQAINTPGAIPNVQGAWDTFVETTCLEAKQDALRMYDVLLESHFSDKLPCDNNEIRLNHNAALQECEVQFMAEVSGISTDTVEMHITDLKVSTILADLSLKRSRQAIFTLELTKSIP